ncbi:Aste57867_9590 [Aphanomyces stellatus]|uniref:Aste57867_9590 protein n=1 Tax=Aphanomyces stellatus TaxID=120398 RepID=A0A485KNQ1_9STRA|nr:hypothetical protein As57867_009552 [Aphanomyces stellatus]VFT86469.1 Aste57867_9590 [Aphanomyces stellatus]
MVSTDTNGDSLLVAARQGSVDAVKALLDDPETSVHKTRWSGVTALHRACEAGDIATIQVLLDHGAAVNARSTWGWYTPLHVASRYGREDAIHFLLAHGADWNQKDKNNVTPFKYAVRAGFAAMAHRIDEAVLRAAKAEPRAPNEAKSKAL